MNSTNTQQKAKIQLFFEQELIPLAAEIKKQQDIIPWISLDTGASTYYKTRQKTSMSKLDFEIGGHSTLETFAADLAAFWNNNDDSKLSELVPSLAKLANELHVAEDQSEEISPYVYVMF